MGSRDQSIGPNHVLAVYCKKRVNQALSDLLDPSVLCVFFTRACLTVLCIFMYVLLVCVFI